MSTVWVPSRSIIKPPLGSILDRIHPLSQGLVFYTPLNDRAVGAVIRDGESVYRDMVHGLDGLSDHITTYYHLFVRTDGPRPGLYLRRADSYIEWDLKEAQKPTTAITMMVEWYGSFQDANQLFFKYGTTSTTDITSGLRSSTVGSGRPYFVLTTSTQKYQEYPSSDPEYYEGRHALVLTYDGSTMKGYLNGEEVVSISASGTIQWPTTSNEALRLCGVSDALYHYCAGIWNRALSPEEVSSLWIAPYQMIRTQPITLPIVKSSITTTFKPYWAINSGQLLGAC